MTTWEELTEEKTFTYCDLRTPKALLFLDISLADDFPLPVN